MALHIDHITLQGRRLASGTLDDAYPLELSRTATTLEVRISGTVWLVRDLAENGPPSMADIRGLIYGAIARYREAARTIVEAPEIFQAAA